MSHWREMAEYVRFTQEDAACLARVAPYAEPLLPEIVEDFYAATLRFPGSRGVFVDAAQVERLKQTLQVWMRQLLAGPHDEAYWQRRYRIGQVHVRIGLPQRYMFTAMNLLRTHLCGIVRENFPDENREICDAVGRITDLELAVMCESYMEAHEQRELKTLQDLIIRNMPVTVLCLDESGRVTSATHPTRGMLAPSGQEGVHYSAYIDPALLEAADFVTHVGEALATQHEVTIPRVVVESETGQRFFRLSVVPLEHELARIIVNIEELTDVVQAQARAQQAESLARLGTLAANVAHEIRNPLSAISATLQVIGSSLTEDDRRKRIIGKVNEQVLRLDRLVTDLLGYARPASPVLQLADLAEIAREAAAQSDAAPEVLIEGALVLRIDAQLVRQILINLLQNARAAAGPGAVVLRVGPGPVLEVRDEGPGVPAELTERIFEPFVTTKTRGTGLGLAISRKLAESMGASLRLIERPPGQGACFRLTFTLT